MTYISSLSLTTPMRQSVQQIQSSLSQITNEMSSGKKDDLGLSLGAQTGNALSLQSEMDRLNSYTNTNTLATSRLSSTSNALTAMVSSAQSVAADLIQATGVGSSSTLQSSAQDALNSLTGALNTSSAGQFLFAGIKTDTQPLAATAPTDLVTSAKTAFQTYLNGPPVIDSSTMTGPQMQSFLDGQFSALFNDSNWGTNVSQASSTQIQTQVSPSQSLTTSVTANDPSIRQVAQGYTMLSALVGQNLSANALSAVKSSASKLVSSGISGLDNVAGAVGIAQATLDSTNTQIGAQVQVLTSNVSSLEDIDATVLPTKLAQLTTQLNASYEMTAKLGQLSLVNYLTS